MQTQVILLILINNYAHRFGMILFLKKFGNLVNFHGSNGLIIDGT